jgi:hypothetical protein
VTRQDIVHLGDKVKTVLLDGKAVLLVVPVEGNGNRTAWQTCSRQQLKHH